MKKILSIIFILILFFTACESQKRSAENNGEKHATGHSPDESTRTRDTVILYTGMLSEGYRKQDMKPLAQVATEGRTMKAYYHMAALGEGGIKMDLRLNEINFKDVKIAPPDRADVSAEEKWEYKYIDFKSGKEVYDNSVDYVLTYHLVKISGKWLVDDITIISSKEKKSERYEPIEGPSGRQDSKSK